MISLIICSINEELLRRLKLNIRETMGVPHEIISIDNTASKAGICEVYNQAGSTAKFPILCFIHEDILFYTKNWGRLIIQHFNDPKVGLIGLAGGDTKGIVPSSWSTVFKSKEMNLIQHKNGAASGKHIFVSGTSVRIKAKKVVTIDGFFLCTRKEVFLEFKFDEINLKGFHGYDIDYSLQVFSKYEVRVIFDVLVQHYSLGNPDRSWVESILIISKKWRKSLPVSVYPLSKAEFNSYHWKSLQVFLYHLIRLHYPYHQIIFYYLYYSFTKYFTIRRFLSMGKYLILAIFSKQREVNMDDEIATNSVKKIKAIIYN